MLSVLNGTIKEAFTLFFLVFGDVEWLLLCAMRIHPCHIPQFPQFLVPKQNWILEHTVWRASKAQVFWKTLLQSGGENTHITWPWVIKVFVFQQVDYLLLLGRRDAQISISLQTRAIWAMPCNYRIHTHTILLYLCPFCHYYFCCRLCCPTRLIHSL